MYMWDPFYTKNFIIMMNSFYYQSLVESCPYLRELDVSDSSQLTPATLNAMVDRLHYLESVSTSRCYNITPSSYLMLTAW